VAKPSFDANRPTRLNGVQPALSPAPFRFGPLHGHDLLVTFAAEGATLVLFEWLKLIWRDRLRL
jgi:hypothetical protein